MVQVSLTKTNIDTIFMNIYILNEVKNGLNLPMDQLAVLKKLIKATTNRREKMYRNHMIETYNNIIEKYKIPTTKIITKKRSK